jgi:hypothetical protein
MKNIFIFLLAIITTIASAQSVFPDHGLWEQKYHSISWGHGGEIIWEYTTYSNFSIIGDTVSQNDTLLKLFKNQQFNGYIYVQNQKVFYGTHPDSLRILFDFGLNPGDTFTFNASSYSYGILQSTVSSIDSVLIKGEYRKRINFNNFPGYGAAQWIEGIGDVNFGGIELDYSYASWQGNTNTLLCFSQDGLNLYGTCTLGIPETAASFNIWPNPTTGPITIRSNFSGRPQKIFIFDDIGRLILEDVFKSLEAEIDLPDFKKGIYLIVIQKNGESTCRKIVKK